MFDALKRLFTGKKAPTQGPQQQVETCPDCGVRVGELHDFFCTKERCPFCHGQLASCDCIRTILKLSEPEQQALDEYIDDSVPPLSDIMQRWRDVLVEQGRIPFEAIPDDPIRAAYRGDVDAIRRFIEDGFSPNAGNDIGYTALMGAARGERLDVIRLLLSHGGTAELADQRGCTALHCIVAQPVNDASKQVACLRALLDAGADPNARSEEGITPLMKAAWFGCTDSARELLKCGADPLLRDSKGRSARDLASEQGHKDLEDLLKQQ